MAADDKNTTEEQATKLSLEVKVDSPGDCERHITVTVSEGDVQRYFEQEFDELMPKAELPGFRPGKAPRKLVVNRFREQIADQVKSKLLMDSMTQINEEQAFSAISEPQLDINSVELPDEGALTFEFDLEVRPDFDMPKWNDLPLKKMVGEITDEDVQRELDQLLLRFATLEDSDEPAVVGDFLTLNTTFTHEGEVISSLEEEVAVLRPTLSFSDTTLEGFDQLLADAKPGDKRQAELTISEEAENEELQGKTVQAEFEVVGVRRVERPQLDEDMLERLGGYDSADELKGDLKDSLENRLEYRQQQQIRTQITGILTASANWELPLALLRRQASREVQRTVNELQSRGFSSEAIQSQKNQIQRRSLEYTAAALKEHFILERIAEEENIEASDQDYNVEIELIARQSNMSARRVRSRLEKQGDMDALRNQIIERKVIELILSKAEVEEETLPPHEEEQETALNHAVAGGGETTIPEAVEAPEPEQIPGTAKK